MINNILIILTGFIINIVGLTNVSELIPSEITPTDYIFIVSINTQKNYLYYKNTLIDEFNVSTGSKTRYKGNRELPEGIWKLTQRIETNLKPIYGARLIYLDKYNYKTKTFIRTNKAFHGTNEPENIGNPTSMGCVYHYDHDIIYLYSFIPENTLVISVKNI